MKNFESIKNFNSNSENILGLTSEKKIADLFKPTQS